MENKTLKTITSAVATFTQMTIETPGFIIAVLLILFISTQE